MPGELPYFAESGKSLRIKCSGNKLIADRVEENAPIFKESIQISEDSSRAMQSVSIPVPHTLAAGEHEIAVASDADSEDAGEEPLSRMQRLVRESQSPEYLPCHFPKKCSMPNLQWKQNVQEENSKSSA